MGYFANGTMGTLYEEKYCSKCVHYDHPDEDSNPTKPTCPVWMLHMMWSYHQNLNEPPNDTTPAGVKNLALEELIPRDGTTVNGQCKMFIEAADASSS